MEGYPCALSWPERYGAEEPLLPRGVAMEGKGDRKEEVTAHAGVMRLVETGRRSGVMEPADRVLAAKKNPKGLSHGQMVESFVLR